ncbi:hypothetical protein CLV98_10514 [Dyadobacter jejuensis]|uniref:Uncharacterized protein n=1 Tax=Dyadobacter jejuensis TaxID=1082580 RepID=A0A316ALA5_9BACT|nr:hypothetical protein [Dyadobacter jejuensis]PWJ57834.1 hypothetical protein CLV98_10514 [Dyadobacter jejuensis]
MVNIPSQAISFILYYGGKSAAETLAKGNTTAVSKLEPVTEETPQFKNISIKPIEIKGAHEAVFLQGLPEMNLKNIELDNLLIEADQGFTIIDATGVSIKDVKMATKKAPAMDIYNGKKLKIKDVTIDSTTLGTIAVGGSESGKIKIDAGLKIQTEIGKEVSVTAVIFK